MAAFPVRRLGWRVVLLPGVVGALLLAGCADFTKAEFTTNQDVALRRSQSEGASVTAWVPKGTPVVGLGWVGSECECWLVATPYGTGFVYTHFLDMHLADVNP